MEKTKIALIFIVSKFNMDQFQSGTYFKKGSYKSFQPHPINRQWEVKDPQLTNLLSTADRQVGRLDMFSEHVPNVDLFIRMHVVKEATQSSKIEGTQTNIEEALREKENIDPEKRDDWEEIQNYISAMNYAIGSLDELPFSVRLIREAHRILLQGVRGQHKMPGEFRKSQNWIGGATIQDAVFIPPSWETVADLMSDLEKFAHNEDVHVPPLIRIAIIHYQFETIHPFLDGNGRVGRLLIPLYLVSENILKKPVLYLSDFFEKNRQLYYDNLMQARTRNNMNQWLKFFLVGVSETAKNGVETFNKILMLKQRTDLKISTLGSRSGNAQKVASYLYNQPLLNARDVSELTGLSMASSYTLIRDLEKLEILKETTGEKRDRYYLFKEYLDLFR